MNALQIETKTHRTLTIHTTLFDLLAAMQDEAGETEVDVQKTDAQIVSAVTEWMQSSRIAMDRTNPVLSAA